MLKNVLGENLINTPLQRMGVNLRKPAKTCFNRLQPEGLTDGSRWSFRGKGGTTPTKAAPPPGAPGGGSKTPPDPPPKKGVRPPRGGAPRPPRRIPVVA